MGISKRIAVLIATGSLAAGCKSAGSSGAAAGAAGSGTTEINGASCTDGVCSIDQAAAELWSEVKVYGSSGQLLATFTSERSDVAGKSLITSQTLTLESGVTAASVMNAMGGSGMNMARLNSDYGLFALQTMPGGGQGQSVFTVADGGTVTATRTYTAAGGNCPAWAFSMVEQIGTPGGATSRSLSREFTCASETSLTSTNTITYGTNTPNTSTTDFTIDNTVTPAVLTSVVSTMSSGQTITFGVAADRSTATIPSFYGPNSGTASTCTAASEPGFFECPGGNVVSAAFRNSYPFLNGVYAVDPNPFVMADATFGMFDDRGRRLATLTPGMTMVQSVAEYVGETAKVDRFCATNASTGAHVGRVEFNFGGGYTGPTSDCATTVLLSPPSMGGGGGMGGPTGGGGMGGGGSGMTLKVVSSNYGKMGAVFAETNSTSYLYIMTQSSIGRYVVQGPSAQTLDTTWGTNGFVNKPSNSMQYMVSCGGKVWSLDTTMAGYTWKKLTFSDSSPYVTASTPTSPVIPASGFSSLNIDSAYCIDNKYLSTGRSGSDSIIVYDAVNETAVGSYAASGYQFSNHPVVPLRKADGTWAVLEMNVLNGGVGSRLVELPAAGGGTQSFDFKASGLTSHTLFAGYDEVKDIAIDNGSAPGTQSKIALIRAFNDYGATGNAMLKITFQTVDEMITNATTSGYSFADSPDISYVTSGFTGTGSPSNFSQVFACVAQNYFAIAGWGDSGGITSWLAFGIDGGGNLDSAFNSGAEMPLSTDPFNGYIGRMSSSVACGTGGSASTAFAYANGSATSQSSTTNVVISP